MDAPKYYELGMVVSIVRTEPGQTAESALEAITSSMDDSVQDFLNEGALAAGGIHPENIAEVKERITSDFKQRIMLREIVDPDAIEEAKATAVSSLCIGGMIARGMNMFKPPQIDRTEKSAETL